MGGVSNMNLPLRSNVPTQVSWVHKRSLRFKHPQLCSHSVLFLGDIISTPCFFLFVFPPAGKSQRPHGGPASARVPQQPPSPASAAAAAARAPAAHHDDEDAGHKPAAQHAQRGRRCHADADGGHQPSVTPGQPAAVSLPGLQLRYRPALSSSTSSSRLLQPLLLPSVPQSSSGKPGHDGKCRRAVQRCNEPVVTTRCLPVQQLRYKNRQDSCV